MQVFYTPQGYQPPPQSVVTIGTYDGVHLGHKVILDRIVALARSMGAESVVLSFHPHPRLVVGPPGGSLQLLSTVDEKITQLRACGIDRLMLYPFTKDFSETTSASFIQQVLVEQIGASTVVVGYDHRFGHDRDGGLDDLRLGGQHYGFSVEEISPQQIDEAKVSSTRIRKALLSGEVSEANRLLGYHYPLTGTVVQGKMLGRTIGYPTANLSVPDPHKLIPKLGIYAVRCLLSDGRTFPGMLSIGTNPTVAEGLERTIEVYLIGFSGDLYGQQLTLKFISFLRDEAKFSSLDSLKAQMAIDEQQSLSAYNALPKVV